MTTQLLKPHLVDQTTISVENEARRVEVDFLLFFAANGVAVTADKLLLVPEPKQKARAVRTALATALAIAVFAATSPWLFDRSGLLFAQ